MVTIEHTSDLIRALRSRYDDGGFSYAFLEQVPDGTSASCNRHADALAIQLWESRGLEIIGFELKVSRQDWIKELRQPKKAEAIAKYCNEWYLVVGDESIVQFGELPSNWGLMVPHTKNSLKINKPAVKNLNAIPVDMPFLCAVLRRATQQLTGKKNKEYERGYNEAHRENEGNVKEAVKRRDDELDVLRNKIKKFKESSGVDINEYWTPVEKIGDAVKFVLDKKYISELQQLKRVKQSFLQIATDIDGELEKFKEELKKNNSEQG
jgi:hypothetical protein